MIRRPATVGGCHRALAPPRGLPPRLRGGLPPRPRGGLPPRPRGGLPPCPREGLPQASKWVTLQLVFEW